MHEDEQTVSCRANGYTPMKKTRFSSLSYNHHINVPPSPVERSSQRTLIRICAKFRSRVSFLFQRSCEQRAVSDEQTLIAQSSPLEAKSQWPTHTTSS